MENLSGSFSVLIIAVTTLCSDPPGAPTSVTDGLLKMGKIYTICLLMGVISIFRSLYREYLFCTIEVSRPTSR